MTNKNQFESNEHFFFHFSLRITNAINDMKTETGPTM